mgnify:CR=1 FL=1|jgi:hypothetical protein
MYNYKHNKENSVAAPKRVNYLNNKDILKEIHKSKTTYCSFAGHDKDHQFDIIVLDVKKINKARIKEAKQLRIVRIKKETGEIIKPRQIEDTDLIFRVMTWEHIPKIPKKPTKAQLKKRAKLEELFDDEELQRELDDEYGITDQVHVKVNFPPFYHYKINDAGEPIVIGKSHWNGDLEKGHFDVDHGSMTPKLAHMFIKLCERYATRANWRGYTYNDEMRGQALLQLSQIGLQFDESKSQNPFAYYTAAITNSFTRVLNLEKKHQNIRDDILENEGLNPSWTRQLQGKGENEEELQKRIRHIRGDFVKGEEGYVEKDNSTK